jgi:hypothetical protein
MGKPLHWISTGIDIFFSIIFWYFYSLLLAYIINFMYPNSLPRQITLNKVQYYIAYCLKVISTTLLDS